jgi:hypothetical protein
MKKIYLTLLTISLCLMLASCINQTQTNQSSSGSSGTDGSISQTTGSDGSTNGSTTGSTGGYTTGSSGSGSGTSGCLGTTADGTGTGSPIHHQNLFLAGYQDWMPQVNSDPLAQMTFLTPQEASILHSSDDRLRVRFVVKPQPIPPSNQTYCYGRNTGVQIAPYGKLKFEIYLRDIVCSDGSTVSCPSENYELGPRYGGPIFVGPVDVNSCSEIIDLAHLRNQTNFGTTIEVAAVKSDQTCEANGTFCPAEKNVRSIDCWQMTMQVVTDATQDFID